MLALEVSESCLTGEPRGAAVNAWFSVRMRRDAFSSGVRSRSQGGGTGFHGAGLSAEGG